MHCLSHHEILALAGPFAQAQWTLDLPASDRQARRLVFRRPRSSVTGGDSSAGLNVWLELESLPGGWLRLRRRAVSEQPMALLEAVLESSGNDPAVLLECVTRIPAVSQFSRGSGFVVASSGSVQIGTGTGRHGRVEGRPTADAQDRVALEITRSVAHIRGQGQTAVTLTMAAAGSYAGSASINVESQGPVDLPDDLLAVMGWDWGVLRASPAPGRYLWSSSVRLRGAGKARERDHAYKLGRVVTHLARTLDEGPDRFHDACWMARWAVFARRAIPAVVWLMLVTELAFAQQLQLAGESIARLLLLGAPPALLALFLLRSEAPRFEMPGIPRRPAGLDWARPRSERLSPRMAGQ